MKCDECTELRIKKNTIWCRKGHLRKSRTGEEKTYERHHYETKGYVDFSKEAPTCPDYDGEENDQAA